MKAVFDTLRRLLGRPLKQSDVNEMNVALKGAFPEWAEAQAPADDWVALAAPLVERFEGMAKLLPGGKVQAYPDPGTGGKPWTIGIGSTKDEAGNAIAPGTIWTVERARKRFEADLAVFGHQVDLALGGKPTTASQKAALVAWAYNVGVAAAAKSTLFRKHLAGDHEGAAQEFARWNRAGGRVLRGLVRRREAEAALYRSGSVT